MAEKMKPSRIGWIKDIPESWKTSKVKFLATEPDTLFLDGDWIESDVIEETGIRYLTSGNVGAGFYKDQGSGYISEKTFRELHCLKVFPGDLMISRLNEPIGRACIVPEGEPCYVVAVDNVILRPNKEYDRKFIMYAMNTEGYAEHGNMIARGATMSRVSRSQLGQFWLAFPGISEQRAIADFLDSQCAKIDSVIADLEKQIETLQKYKKSLITETVTKGLDRSVPMKDSGVEWIGDIPENWDCKKLKYIISEPLQYGANETGNDYRDDYPRYIRITDITEENTLKDEGKLSLQPDIAAPYILKNGDILFARSGATVGKTFFYTADCGLAAFAGYLIRARINPEMALPRFVYYSTLGVGYENWKNTVFTQATIQNIGADKYAQFFVTLPKLTEQKSIVEYLDNKCVRIDDIIKNKQQQLLAVEQHKKSLIYEYVTGKKRVTEVN